MNTLEILMAARERLSDPEMWSPEPTCGQEAQCVGLTLSDLGDKDYDAHHALALVITGSDDGIDEAEGDCRCVYAWNDALETSHADVLAALDAAIGVQQAGTVV